MVAVTENSKLYQDLFKGQNIENTFDSRFPSYENIVNGFLDPSNKEFSLTQDKLNGDQTGDIRDASRILLKDLITNRLDGNPINFPSFLLDGFSNVIQSSSVSTNLTNNQVLNKVMSAASYDVNNNAIKGVEGVVIGGALLTLSVTVPLLGMIASAIVGLAAGISSAVSNRKEKKKIEDEKTRALLYKTFPPLQVAGSGADSELVNIMRSVFQLGDWTDVYAPRFKGEWRGLERKGGFAFAPGTYSKDSDNFAGDVDEKFDPSGGFGIIPGTDIVTSVVQVNLPHDPEDPYSSEFQKYMTKSGPNNAYGPDPRTLKGAWSRVTDVGIYYPSTGKIASYWWEIALQEGNWYKFRIDTLRLHKEWKDYCDGGIDFIRNKCYKWSQGSPNKDYENYFGSAIYYAIGAWSGRVNGGTTLHPKYENIKKPLGYTRDEMTTSNLYKQGEAINSSKSGAFLPLSNITDKNGKFISDWWCDSCLGTIYDRGYNIKAKLEDLKHRQIWDLYSTLACAYCSENDAAFNDLKLLDLLRKRRSILLTHKDRLLININDVLNNEPGVNGGNWKDQLLKSGVPKTPPVQSKFGKNNIKMSSGNNIPPDLKPPSKYPVIDSGPLNPWDPNYKPTRVGRKDSSSSSSSGGIVLLAGIGIGGYLLLR